METITVKIQPSYNLDWLIERYSFTAIQFRHSFNLPFIIIDSLSEKYHGQKQHKNNKAVIRKVYKMTNEEYQIFNCFY